MSGAKTEKILCGRETLILETQDWDTKMLGLSCGRVLEIQGEAKVPDYSALPTRLKELGYEYVIARRPQSEWTRLHALQAAGFYLVDGILSFASTLKGQVPEPEGLFRLAKPEDADVIGELAGRSFVHSRFHNDPLLSAEVARRVHVEWARNSCMGQAADAVLIGEVNGEIAGFSTCRIQGSKGTIVLVAVDPRFKGQGWGKKLTAKACNWFVRQKIAQIEIQTQTSNLTAVSLYSRAGFDLQSSSFTLRWAAKS